MDRPGRGLSRRAFLRAALFGAAAALGAVLQACRRISAPERRAKGTPSPPPPPPPIAQAAVPSEFALIDRYFTGDFFPRTVVVKRGVRSTLYFTRHHQEHVNRIRIEPFVDEAPVVAGELRILSLTPDRAGKFEIVNVGHGFAAKFLVVETDQEVLEAGRAKDLQEAALILSAQGPRTLPGTVVAKRGVPMHLHATGLTEDHWVSIAPFFNAPPLSGKANVSGSDTSPLEFVPAETGEFEIRCEAHGEKARLLVVEDFPTWVDAQPAAALVTLASGDNLHAMGASTAAQAACDCPCGCNRPIPLGQPRAQ